MLNVVFVTPELAPMAKVGGLADVAGSLPRALTRLGHRVTPIVPLYGSIDRERHGIRPAGLSLDVEMDGCARRATLHRARANNVVTYFVENTDYFDGRSIYGSPEDYPDNAFRFAFFARAALKAVEALGLAADLFHIHDWPTALLPLYQRSRAGERLPVVLTIHNLGYQGIFDSSWLERLGLPREVFRIDGLEFYGRINFLKGGMVSAERLTTVSPTYAREIQSRELGAGLEGVARMRSRELVGILNGLELSDWHPGKDPALFAPYASNRLRGKAEGKRRLQEALGLTVSEDTPLLAAIGRLDRQKGFDLLLEATPELLHGGAQLVVLGSGDERTLQAFRDLGSGYPTAMSVNRGFQDELGRRIYAGADLFLMPSRYEPCGLGQMIALRYGTLPVVRATGGLADSIRDLDEDPEGGNGFVFREFDVDAFVGAVRRAMKHFGDRRRWRRWVARGMRTDFSWKASAQKYVEVYEGACSAN